MEPSNYDLVPKPKRSEKSWKQQWRNEGNQQIYQRHFQCSVMENTQWQNHQLGMKKPHRKQGEAGFFIFLGQGLWESNDNMDSLTRRILQNFEFIFRKPPTHTSQQKGTSLQQWKLCWELPSSIVQKQKTKKNYTCDLPLRQVLRNWDYTYVSSFGLGH